MNLSNAIFSTLFKIYTFSLFVSFFFWCTSSYNNVPVGGMYDDIERKTAEEARRCQNMRVFCSSRLCLLFLFYRLHRFVGNRNSAGIYLNFVGFGRCMLHVCSRRSEYAQVRLSYIHVNIIVKTIYPENV